MESILSTVRVEFQTAQRNPFDRSWQVTNVCSSFSRLYYIESGYGTIEHHDTRFTLQPEHFFLIPEQSLSHYHSARKLDVRWLHGRATIFGTFDILRLCPFVLAPPAAERKQMLAWFDRLIALDAKMGMSDMKRLEAEALLQLLLLPFLRESKLEEQAGQIPAIARLEPTLQYIETHLAETLTVPQLARKAGMHPSGFTRTFTAALGLPPARHIRQRRIAKARALLADTRLSLAEIAGQTGFSDAFHLSKTVKQITGLSPRQLRQTSIAFPLPF